MKIHTLVLGFFLAFPAFSFACELPPGPGPGTEENFKQADAVFVATVVPESGKGRDAAETVALRVLKTFKGQLSAEPRYLQNRHGTCAFRMKEGATYLIFANLEKDGQLSSSAFTGTGDLQNSLPGLRALIEQEKSGGKFSKKTDTSEAPGAFPAMEKVKPCGSAKDTDTCHGEKLACSYVNDLKLKAACYTKARGLLGKHLKVSWLK